MAGKLKSEKGIWDLAIEVAEAQESQRDEEKDSSSTAEEANLILLGSQNSGKTSIALRLADSDDQPKPTTALEYTYSRLGRGAKLVKDVISIWELGGGTSLTKLLEIPINKNNIQSITVAIVLDLSQPESMWSTVETLLQATRSRLDAAINETANSTIAAALKKNTLQRVGEHHADINVIKPFPVPLIIIGNKYDIFQDKFDSEKRKVVCRTLRFLAHMNGAALQFCSTKIDSLMQRMRVLLALTCFPSSKRTDEKEHKIMSDHNKPIIVPFGADTLENIGSPLAQDGDIGNVAARTAIDLWKQRFIDYFPQEKADEPLKQADPTLDEIYQQPVIDAIRKQKAEELERYRRLAERRTEDAMKQNRLKMTS